MSRGACYQKLNCRIRQKLLYPCYTSVRKLNRKSFLIHIMLDFSRIISNFQGLLLALTLTILWVERKKAKMTEVCKTSKDFEFASNSVIVIITAVDENWVRIRYSNVLPAITFPPRSCLTFLLLSFTNICLKLRKMFSFIPLSRLETWPE